MAQNNAKLEELKKWLESNNFGQFVDKLNEAGVNKLDDLRILKQEEEIQELVGPNGINMGVVYRRKFINCVLELQNKSNNNKAPYEQKDIEIEEEEEDQEEETNNNNDDAELASSNNNNSQRRNSLKMSKEEERSLTQLVQQIRLQTQHLQSCKSNLSNLRKQFEESKTNLTETFEKAMSSLVIRRKQLENALEKAESETIGKLEERIKELTKFAQTLLACKGQVENKLKSINQSQERDQYVVNEIKKALQNAPKDDVPNFNLVFDQGETPLVNFIDNYGSVAVGKRKSGKSSAQSDESTQN